MQLARIIHRAFNELVSRTRAYIASTSTSTSSSSSSRPGSLNPKRVKTYRSCASERRHADTAPPRIWSLVMVFIVYIITQPSQNRPSCKGRPAYPMYCYTTQAAGQRVAPLAIADCYSTKPGPLWKRPSSKLTVRIVRTSAKFFSGSLARVSHAYTSGGH